MKITSKQWKEFKEWRKKETLKIMKSEEIDILNKRIGEEFDKKWFRSFDITNIERLGNQRDSLFDDMPDETIEECYKWLLDNDKIK